MIGNKTALVIITARGGSKGLPGKNIRQLCGKPLIGWPIAAALKSKYIDRIIVSTDDSEIARIARQEGADVPFIRSDHLATSTATSFSVMRHSIEFLAERGDHYDYCVLLEPTSPLTESNDIDKALSMLVAQRGIADSIVGVTKTEATHPDFNVTINDNGLIHPYRTDRFTSVLRRQDIKTYYHYEGSLYISDIKILLAEKSFYHSRTLPYIVPKWKSFEVDDIVDFLCIEAIFKQRENLKKGRV